MKTKKSNELFKHICNLQTLAGLNSYHDAVILYKKLHRLEALIHRENENDCNGTSGLTEQQEADRDKRRFNTYQSLLPGVSGLFINGDPRGYSLKIHVKQTQELYDKGINLDRDWGGYGLLAPDFD